MHFRIHSLRQPVLCFALMLCICSLNPVQSAQEPPSGSRPAALLIAMRSPAFKKAIVRAGANKDQLLRALHQVPGSQWKAVQFLIENMPEVDLKTLSADYLKESVGLSYEAINNAPWKAKIPQEVFFNDILPYACLNEQRDNSRKRLRELTLPLIAGCETPAEAAQKINERLFPLVKVQYNTGRKRADQSPFETMESGKATCTGLSILLVQACRSVGVPARVVGTPLWTNLRGNHTWVEIWDGDWHFTGAGEPDSQGLDRGWFTHDASLARKDIPKHAIYASSFRKSKTYFPLEWDASIRWVNAENVTERYHASTDPEAGVARLLIRVLDGRGNRVPALVTMRDGNSPTPGFKGFSKGNTADLNDMLAFKVPRLCPPREYEISVEYANQTVKRKIKGGGVPQEVFEIRVP